MIWFRLIANDFYYWEIFFIAIHFNVQCSKSSPPVQSYVFPEMNTVVHTPSSVCII